MADQNIKTNYKSSHPNAKDVSTVEEKHNARRELNRTLRDEQKQNAPKQPAKVSAVKSTAELFSGRNILETGKIGAITGIGIAHTGMQNVGKRIASTDFAPSWIGKGGGGIGGLPQQFTEMPGVIVQVKARKKRKPTKTRVVVSTRPEWIRF